MRHLFCAEGLAALEAIMRRRPLLAFDFDGTLAPIVDRPTQARVPIAVGRRLQRLAEALPVAIISGRAVDDVRRRLNFSPWYLVGSHGAEDPADNRVDDHSAALDGLRLRLKDRRDDLRRAGVTVEDKGASIALHYRLAADRQRAHDVVAAALDKLGPDLTVFGGKLVVNVVSSHAMDKAGALKQLVARAGSDCAFFAGDDVNDEPVFAAGRSDWLTVRIGRDDPNSTAMFYLDSPREMAAMLDRMIGALGRS